jgi:hypothetical protein
MNAADALAQAEIRLKPHLGRINDLRRERENI